MWARFPSADSNHRCILRRDPLIWDGPVEKMETYKSGYFVAHEFVQQISLVRVWLVEKMTSHATGPSSIVTRPQEHCGWWRTVNCRDSEPKNTRFLSTHGKTDWWDCASWSWTTSPLKHKGGAGFDRSPSLKESTSPRNVLHHIHACIGIPCANGFHEARQPQAIHQSIN